MYFPFLRGKQFELIALRELSSKIIADKISPVIEPVKSSTSTLEKTLRNLFSPAVKINLILNPTEGDFKNDHSKIINFAIDKISAGYTHIIPAFIIANQDGLEFANEIIQQYDLNDVGYSLIHYWRSNDAELASFFQNNSNAIYNIIDDHIINRYRRLFDDSSLISLSDSFVSKSKNSDYIHNDDELFTEEHLYFLQDNLIGFCDFLTIGRDYSESGFLPYAVAIHLTYVKEDQKIWIKHFVSDSNDDNSDVPGKFREALDKLIVFINQKNIQTEAADQFRILGQTGSYPGLGTIKKLSIMHHIELVQSLL